MAATGIVTTVQDQLTPKSVKIMKPKAVKSDDMRAEYNFDYSKAVRGKYYRRILKEGANVVMLEPDIAKAFPTSDAVNDALRVVLQAGRAVGRIAPRSTSTRASRVVNQSPFAVT